MFKAKLFFFFFFLETIYSTEKFKVQKQEMEMESFDQYLLY